MNINFNLFSNQVGLLKDNIASSFTNRQKIITIASIALSFLAICYVIINYCFKSKNISDHTRGLLDDSSNWNRYLQDHCDIEANCRLEDAKIIFLGDQHADDAQNIVRQNVIKHYALEDQKHENLVLIEGLDLEDFPNELGKKKFIIESWEQEEHYRESHKILNEYCKMLQEMKLKLTELGQLKVKYKNTHLDDVKKTISVLLNEIKEMNIKLDDYEEKLAAFEELRNQDLIAKVKASIKSNQKIFVIAGSNHLKSSNYNILDLFNDLDCAVIIPKETQLGEEKAKRVAENFIKLGNYDRAYYTS